MNGFIKERGTGNGRASERRHGLILCRLTKGSEVYFGATDMYLVHDMPCIILKFVENIQLFT